LSIVSSRILLGLVPTASVIVISDSPSPAGARIVETEKRAGAHHVNPV
jgi:hypothetical protein